VTMNPTLGRPKLTRLIWTVLVTGYFLVFFRNFFLDAMPETVWLPLVFAYGFVLWLALEYYYGSPFFQSGMVRSSSLWRGLFAFFIYPLLGYCAADMIWWHWTQIPLPPVVAWVLGLALFGFGTYIRLDTLFSFVRLGSRPTKGQQTTEVPLRKLVETKWYRRCRNPRYFATLLQVAGAALAFNSWGGLVLALAIGFPLVLAQAKYEDRWLAIGLKTEYERYRDRVPMLFPKFGRSGR